MDIPNTPESAVSNVPRLLVPCDFSADAGEALDYARDLAQRLGASLELLNVVETLNYAGEYSYVLLDIPHARQEAMKHLEFLRKGLPPDVSVELTVREGVPWQEIVAEAQEKGCAMIVMSTHGATGLMHVLLGRTAERVVRHAKTPVLIVPILHRNRTGTVGAQMLNPVP